MKTSQFPRRKYVERPTPIQALPAFCRAIGGANISMKRDDLLPGTGGGNKTRKLEFLMGDALSKGADCVVTCGGVQSNHCRLTLAWAIREELPCHLVLQENSPELHIDETGGNRFLYELLGAASITVIPNDADMAEASKAKVAELTSEGNKPCFIPIGGSNAIGTLGYVECAREILEQAESLSKPINRIVLVSGSGGTHAGLALGLKLNGSDIPVTGINISRKNEAQVPLIENLVRETEELLAESKIVADYDIDCREGFFGTGYALPTNEMIEAVRLMARTEMILLDPVYTGKAMSGLISLIKSGDISREEHVLFLHSGGAPSLYAFRNVFA